MSDCPHTGNVTLYPARPRETCFECKDCGATLSLEQLEETRTPPTPRQLRDSANGPWEEKP